MASFVAVKENFRNWPKPAACSIPSCLNEKCTDCHQAGSIGIGAGHKLTEHRETPYEKEVRHEYSNFSSGSAYTLEQGQIGWQKKAPLRISEIWAIRVRLEIFGRLRDLALFNLAIDSKLRGCNLVKLRVLEICHGSHVAHRASVIQQKTKQSVQLELTEGTGQSISTWISTANLRGSDYLFRSKIDDSPHISTGSHRIWARTPCVEQRTCAPSNCC